MNYTKHRPESIQDNRVCRILKACTIMLIVLILPAASVLYIVIVFLQLMHNFCGFDNGLREMYQNSLKNCSNFRQVRPKKLKLVEIFLETESAPHFTSVQIRGATKFEKSVKNGHPNDRRSGG